MKVIEKYIKDHEDIELNVFLVNGVTLSGYITKLDTDGFMIDNCYVSTGHYISIAPKINKKEK